jgi:hypothetical protein
MVLVPAATAANNINGSGIAASPVKWFSGNQNDSYPQPSASEACRVNSCASTLPEIRHGVNPKCMCVASKGD